ncbi:MAG: hypothetical protein V7L14_17870 [Nostoc sp.]|uniref:hypothetical protein n=1 Tax=Nostoc sp. TaxID=1180 RepID=UPI002FFC4161
MPSQILELVSPIVVSLGSGFTNEAVFSRTFPDEMNTTITKQQSLRQEFTSYFLETSFDMLNDIKLDDLESIISNEFRQGLPSDTEFGFL